MLRLLTQVRFAVVVACFLGATASAEGARTEHTYRVANDTDQPPATLADVDWLVGSWTGSAFDGTFEEVWNPPSAGSMVGMFKLLKGDEVVFYELLLIVAEAGSLNLKVKHFNADFTAWEEKQDFVNFRLVRLEENAIHFSGLSFYRIDEDEIHAYLRLHDGDRVWEEKLEYHKE